MLLAMLMLGCEETTPTWDLLEPFGTAEVATASTLTPQPPPRLKSQLDQAEDTLEDSLGDDGGDGSAAVDDDGFDNPWGPGADSDEPVATEVSAADEAGTDEIEPPAVSPAGAELMGLPNSAAWGVRLLGTIPHAQPPRAALGLPDGTEVVVSPGSMLPGVGIVIITVGPDRVQAARVTPAGDHAEVEMVNLVAQYARTAD